jgi:hypothetical protein
LFRATRDPGLRNRVGLIKRTGNLRESLNHIWVSGHAARR